MILPWVCREDDTEGQLRKCSVGQAGHEAAEGHPTTGSIEPAETAAARNFGVTRRLESCRSSSTDVARLVVASIGELHREGLRSSGPRRSEKECAAVPDPLHQTAAALLTFTLQRLRPSRGPPEE